MAWWVAQWWEHSPPTSLARASNPSVNAICGLSLLLVLSLAPRGFSPGTPQKPTFPNSNSTSNQVEEVRQSGCATSKSLFFYSFVRSFVRSFIRSLLVYLFTLLSFLFLSLPGTEEGKIHKCSKTYSSQFLETYDVSVIAYCFVVMSRLFNCNLWCLFTLVFLPNLVCWSKSSTRPIGLVSSRGCLAVTVVLPTWCMESHTSGIDYFF